MDFYSRFSLAPHWITREAPGTALALPLSPRPGPHPVLFPGLPLTRATGPQKRKKAAEFLLPPVGGEVLPHGEAVEPPLFVPVLGDRLRGELCDGHSIGLRSGEDRFHDVGREVVQGKDSCDV